AKLGYGAQATPMSQPKRVGEIGVHMANFMRAAVNYGYDFDSLSPMPSTEGGAAVSATETTAIYDEQTFPFATGGWDT
ncbi:hypothetical protein, partial [Bacteroides mediterraneensis]